MLHSNVVQFRLEDGIPVSETVVNKELSPDGVMQHLGAIETRPSISTLIQGASGDRGCVTIQADSAILHIYVVDVDEMQKGNWLRLEAFIEEECYEGYVSVDSLTGILEQLNAEMPVQKAIEEHIL